MSGDVLAQESGAVSLSIGNLTYVVVVAVIALIALAMASVFRREVLAAPEGTTRMQTIGRAVQEGAVGLPAASVPHPGDLRVVVFFFLFLLPADSDIRIGRSMFFIVGAVFSAIIGYVGMWLATRANMRVAAAARTRARPGDAHRFPYRRRVGNGHGGAGPASVPLWSC